MNINKDGLADVIRIFGEPTSYLWSGRTFDKDNLPDTYYIASYSSAFAVFMSHGYIEELRVTGPGYVFRDAIQVGSGIEDVLKVLGQPTKTVEGKCEWKPGVFYKNINGKKGYCYYNRPDQGVRVFFLGNRLTAIYLPRTEPNPGRK